MLKLSHEEYQNLIVMSQADLRDARLRLMQALDRIKGLEQEVERLRQEASGPDATMDRETVQVEDVE